jgi:hypothetical protein
VAVTTEEYSVVDSRWSKAYVLTHSHKQRLRPRLHRKLVTGTPMTGLGFRGIACFHGVQPRADPDAAYAPAKEV